MAPNGTSFGTSAKPLRRTLRPLSPPGHRLGARNRKNPYNLTKPPALSNGLARKTVAPSTDLASRRPNVKPDDLLAQGRDFSHQLLDPLVFLLPGFHLGQHGLGDMDRSAPPLDLLGQNNRLMPLPVHAVTTRLVAAYPHWDQRPGDKRLNLGQL